jgi:hypothetical protein
MTARTNVITTDEVKALRRVAAKSTRVVAWYAHPEEVRGPFGRWFRCSGGDNGMGDPVKYPVPVSHASDDCKFAAAAMNNLVPLLDSIDVLRERAQTAEALLMDIRCVQYLGEPRVRERILAYFAERDASDRKESQS